MRLIFGTLVAAALALCIAACGGSGSSSYGSPAPTPTPTPANGTKVSIVGQQGNKSFNPNPSAASADGNVVFANADNTTHHIVANDGSWDTGNIGPGASSNSIAIPAAGSNFHCVIHPTMVGVVNANNGNTPPCNGQYC